MVKRLNGFLQSRLNLLTIPAIQPFIMLSYLLKVALCWSLFYLLYHLWLGKETFFKINRWYLLGTVLLGLIVPVFDFQWLIPVHEEPAILYYMQPITVGMEELETVIVTASAEESGINWGSILIKIYWLGAAIAFGKFIYGLFKINKLYKEGEKTFFNNYRFISTSAFHVPFSFFKNLFWSKEFVVDEEDKQNILRHEEAHIFQWHSIDIILFEILGVLFWCVPFIYLYKKAIKTTHEYLADDYVVAQASRKKYGQLLLRQSQSGPQGLPWRTPIAVSNSLFSSQLKNRIVMMTKNRSTKMASLKYLAGLPLLALLFLAFSQTGQFSGNVSGDVPGKIIDENLIAEIPKDIFSKDGNPIKVTKSPRFPGDECEPNRDGFKCSNENMNAFIYKNLKYPKEAKEKGLEGNIKGFFLVEPDGSITDPVVERSIGGGCEEEVLRIISLMPKFTPAQYKGEPIKFVVFLIVNFNKDGQSGQFDFPVIGSATDSLPGDEVFKVVEIQPHFPGCEEEGFEMEWEAKKCADTKMLEFIYNNIKYPKEAREKNIQGIVVVGFIIEKDGSISNAKIVREIGGGCGEEALRVVNAMPNWMPGKQRGEKVRVQFNLPVKFKLDSDAPDPKVTDKMPLVIGRSAEIPSTEEMPNPNVIDKMPKSKSSHKVFKVVEDMPRFPGCEEMADAEQRKSCSQKKMLEFIYTNIKYPKNAREKGIEGMSVVKFIVEKDGSIADAEILRSIGGECDEEVLKVVYMMPNWIPGKQSGKAVRTQFLLPVKFKLAPSDANAKIDDPDEMPILESCAQLEGKERLKCSKEGLVNAVYSKIKYPKEAKEKKVEGTVIVKFTVNINGDVMNPRITRSLASGCDEEVIRVIRDLPKWIPGKKDGKPVATEMTLPVQFKLNGEDKIISMDADAKLNESSAVIKAFPNPATDKLSLEIILDEGSYKLIMTDVNGKIIHSKKIEGSGGRTLNITDFPVKDVPRGALYMTITDEKGKVVKRSTVVLQ